MLRKYIRYGIKLIDKTEYRSFMERTRGGHLVSY